jgi:hypothetical protein
MKMGNIQRLQDGLKKLWTNELYSERFNASLLTHKDFDHALKHVFKAAGRLLEMTEEADHGGSMFEIPAVEKYIADLVICAVRLANVAPNGPVDVETVVFDRIRRKMGAELNTEPDLIDVLRKIRNARMEGCSTGEAISKIEYWAREAMAAAGIKE